MATVDIQEVDSILAELGLEPTTGPAPTPSANGGNRISMSGPGARMSGPGAQMNFSGPGARMTGPGAQANFSGPGARMSGPGAMMSGPGARMSGPGAMMSGPGARMNGPGGMGGGLSCGPGANWARQKQEVRDEPIKMATHTPDGRPIIYKGPPCATCGEMIIGQCVNALSKTYHPDCFVCSYCSQPFPGGKFIVHEDEPYCDQDFKELFAPRCKVCGEPIGGKCIRAREDLVFCPNHFVCYGCGVPLKGCKYKVLEGTDEVYCVTCHGKRTVKINPELKICHFCKRPIVGEYILLQGQFVHPEHFRCEECGCELTGGDAHEFEGQLYCAEHYWQLLKKTCAKCQKPIQGRSVTALGKLWHPECFTCETCNKPFSASSFFEKDGFAYCEEHFMTLFGDPCHRCGKGVVSGGVRFIGNLYHTQCFLCSNCDKPLSTRNAFEWEGKPLDKSCFMKLPSRVRKKIEKKRKEEAKAAKKRRAVEKMERKAKFAGGP